MKNDTYRINFIVMSKVFQGDVQRKSLFFPFFKT